VEVDRAYKFKPVNSNLIAFATVDEKLRKTNEVKLMSIGFSDFSVSKVFEETDGKLIEFLA
jgi:hypothetical protein